MKAQSPSPLLLCAALAGLALGASAGPSSSTEAGIQLAPERAKDLLSAHYVSDEQVGLVDGADRAGRFLGTRIYALTVEVRFAREGREALAIRAPFLVSVAERPGAPAMLHGFGSDLDSARASMPMRAALDERGIHEAELETFVRYELKEFRGAPLIKPF